MPFTPFHFGPLVLLWALFLSLDLIALFAGATLLDIEGLLYIFGIYPVLHGVLHSVLGATIVAIVATVLSYELQNALDDSFKKRANIGNIFVSALFGSYSHIVLDAYLYGEMNLAWPLDYWNPFLGAYDYNTIILFCVLSFFAGAVILIARNPFDKEKHKHH